VSQELLTIVKAGQTYPQSEECWDSMLGFQGRHVEVVGSLEPDLAHCLEPCRRKHLDILPALGDIAVFGAVGAADNEVRYV
jgi:hypothetical protein